MIAWRCLVVVALFIRHISGRRVPDFFIIGAAKCGTTSLHTLLNSHKEICDIGIKELHFFHTPSEYAKGYEYYSQQFNHSKCQNKFLIDSTPDYLRHPAVPGRFASTYDPVDLLSKKFIVVLRDPVYALYSWYNHQMNRCTTAMSKHMKALNNSMPTNGWNTSALCDNNHCYPLHCHALAKFAEPTREVRFLATFSQWNNDKRQRTRGHTILQLQLWLKYIHRSQIFIVNLSDLLEKTADVMKRMTDFLGLKEPFPDSVVLPHDNPKTVETDFDCSTRKDLYMDLDPYTELLMKFMHEDNDTLDALDRKPPMELYFSPFKEYRC